MLKKSFIVSPIFIFLFFVSLTANAQTQYVCSPCDILHDTVTYGAPGKCPVCGMELVEKSSVKFTNIAIEDVPKTVAGNKDIIILDVRTPGEHNGSSSNNDLNIGALKGAVNISVDELEKRIGELDNYKDREIIVYCSHSHRSRRASYFLGLNGFTKVRNMLDGISKWESKNPPGGEELYIDYNP